LPTGRKYWNVRCIADGTRVRDAYSGKIGASLRGKNPELILLSHYQKDKYPSLLKERIDSGLLFILATL
jgi:hypothetical protein